MQCSCSQGPAACADQRIGASDPAPGPQDPTEFRVTRTANSPQWFDLSTATQNWCKNGVDWDFTRFFSHHDYTFYTILTVAAVAIRMGKTGRGSDSVSAMEMPSMGRAADGALPIQVGPEKIPTHHFWRKHDPIRVLIY